MDNLLVLNPQKTWFSPEGSMYMGEKSDILKVRMLDYISSFEGNRIFIREKHVVEDEFFVSDKTHSIANSKEFAIEDEFKPYVKDVIDKTRFSAFFKTPLSDQLEKIKAKSVGLIGLETHTSVLFTAEELCNRGYRVTVIEPCVMSRENYFHNLAVSLMANFLGIHIGA